MPGGTVIVADPQRRQPGRTIPPQVPGGADELELARIAVIRSEACRQILAAHLPRRPSVGRRRQEHVAPVDGQPEAILRAGEPDVDQCRRGHGDADRGLSLQEVELVVRTRRRGLLDRGPGQEEADRCGEEDAAEPHHECPAAPRADLFGPSADHGQLTGAGVDLLGGIVKMLEHRPHPCPQAAEVPAQAARAPRSLGLHRADRAPEGNGDIGLREIGQITKDDDLALGDAGACAARRLGRPAPRGVRPLCRRGPPGSAAGVGGGGNDRWPDWRPPGRPNPRGVHAAGTSAGQPGPAPLVPHLRRRTGLPKYGRRRDRRGDRGRRKPARRTGNGPRHYRVPQLSSPLFVPPNVFVKSTWCALYHVIYHCSRSRPPKSCQRVHLSRPGGTPPIGLE